MNNGGELLDLKILEGVGYLVIKPKRVKHQEMILTKEEQDEIFWFLLLRRKYR